MMIPYKELEQHTGLEPVPPVWKTGMLGHYTNATHSGSSLSREHYVQPFQKVEKTVRRYPRKSGTPSKEPLGKVPEKPQKKE